MHQRDVENLGRLELADPIAIVNRRDEPTKCHAVAPVLSLDHLPLSTLAES